MDTQQKQKNLNELKETIEQCDLCKEDTIGVAVFGEGDPNADIMFVGEAPGKQEAKSGRPFIGRSGQMLRKEIRNLDLNEGDVYITSPVKYLPERGTPTKLQIIHAREHFTQQVKIIDPKVMVLLGKTAIFAVLDENIPILQNHGQVIEKNGRKIFLTIHPAAALRFPKYKRIVDEDFEKLRELIKRL